MPIWIALFVIALVAAVAFALSASGRATQLARVQADLEAARADAEKARAAEKAAREELASRKAELAELKEKVKDLKKKLYDEETREKRLRGAEHELRAEAERANLKLQDLLTTLEHKDAEIARLRGELEGHKKRRGAAEPRREVKKEPRPPPAPLPPDVEAMKARLERAEEALRAERKKTEELEHEVKKQRGRAETNHRIYLVTKGELEVAKDKLSTIERKIREMEGGVRRRRGPGSPVKPEGETGAATAFGPSEPTAPVPAAGAPEGEGKSAEGAA